MGWNNWDAYGTAVTESQVKANADVLARDLARYGWRYVVVDIQWYQPGARGHRYEVGALLAMDPYGRLIPAKNKFPSSANGAGFKPLADYVHALGLKFGIHVMRSIPRQAVLANLPVKGTPYRAADVADTTNPCSWNPDMWGVDVTRPGGQAYYDALAELYASWGVDFVKADDLGDHRFQPAEIRALRRALDRTGRPIVLSISPGPARLDSAGFFARHAQLWRISDDFWDNWRLVRAQFDYAREWAPHVGVGNGWPDADMLPFGRLRMTDSAGLGTPSRLTGDEQRTVMTLWSIFRSPLIMGGDLPSLEAATRELLTNPEVLEANQRGRAPRQVLERSWLRVWTSEAPGGKDRYLAVFNLDSTPRRVDLSWAARERVPSGRSALGGVRSTRGSAAEPCPRRVRHDPGWPASGGRDDPQHLKECHMGWRKAVVVGLVAGLAMGLSLFVVGALASRLVYGPQFAPAGKFEPQQLNAWYFLWTKLVIGAVFGLLLTALYELLPLAKRIAGVTGGLTYAACLWLVVYLWGLSHPLVYETVGVRDQLFWAVYTLGGFLGFGAALGFAYARHRRRLAGA